MKRLTQWDEYGNADIIALSDTMPEIYAGLSFSEANAMTDVLNRLGTYEDTEITPQGISKLKQELEWKDKVIELAQRKQGEAERLAASLARRCAKLEHALYTAGISGALINKEALLTYLHDLKYGDIVPKQEKLFDPDSLIYGVFRIIRSWPQEPKEDGGEKK